MFQFCIAINPNLLANNDVSHINWLGNIVN
jgi:hypothetical protein